MQHKVYVGIPGTSFIWGTFLSLSRASSKHIIEYRSDGCGYSCNVDFNSLWVDAINEYEAGNITHFAMLHSDITIETHGWIDILLDIMDDKNAELVSVHSPIKDHRGVTSSGIGHPTIRYSPYKRFSLKEIIEDLPDVFNNEIAGYPNQPLLHNTGCWICDLRKDVFHLKNDDGSLKIIFDFKEWVHRNIEGKWQRVQESEDWLFSRIIWENGAKNTWITKNIKLLHKGYKDWPNYSLEDNYQYKDKDTFMFWKETENPITKLGRLAFELGSECNLGRQHKECPNLHPDRYSLLDTSKELTDEIIVNTATRFYNEYGFSGIISWIYYNEPLLQSSRMFELMDKIKTISPQARFTLWTNGMFIPENCEEFTKFESVVVSNYNSLSRRGFDRLKKYKIQALLLEQENGIYDFDNRLYNIVDPDDTKPCQIPYGEMIFDNFGNSHLCCYDWKGEATFGNLFNDPLDLIVDRWFDIVKNVTGDKMDHNAPKTCKKCSHREPNKDTHLINRMKNVVYLEYDESGNAIEKRNS